MGIYSSTTKEVVMCLSCGCHEYNEDHGDKNHIVLDEVKNTGGPDALDEGRIQKAADAANISLDEAKKNVEQDYSAATA